MQDTGDAKAGAARWVCIHQPCYLPWLGLFHKLAVSDVYVVLDHVQTSHRSWINRVYIRSRQGPLLLSVPVHFSVASGTPVGELRIDHTKNWRTKHRRAILQEYSRAPHLDVISPLVEAVLGHEHEKMIDLNMAFMTRVMELLGIEVDTRWSSALPLSGAKGTDMLVEIVRAAGGTGYISGLGSSGYLEPDRFAAAGQDLAFQSYATPEYPQLGSGPFLPQVSIIDALANLGVDGTRALLKQAVAAGTFQEAERC